MVVRCRRKRGLPRGCVSGKSFIYSIAAARGRSSHWKLVESFTDGVGFSRPAQGECPVVWSFRIKILMFRDLCFYGCLRLRRVGRVVSRESRIGSFAIYYASDAGYALGDFELFIRYEIY